MKHDPIMEWLAIQQKLHQLAERIQHGCGQSGCRIRVPEAKCDCDPLGMANEILDVAVRVEALANPCRK